MSAVPVTIHVCSTCRAAEDDPDGPRAGTRLAADLLRKVRRRAAGTDGVTVVPVECLSVCKRPVTVSFSAPGKWTYVYGDFPPGSADAILAAAGQYAEADEGLIPWRERPEALKRGVVARLPPKPSLPEAAE
jgi:predicted metal-binding protein